MEEGVAKPRSGVSSKSKVTLREITEDTVRAICELSVRDEQRKFIAPNAVSIAQAYFADHAWFRAVHADATPVGFLMLSDRPDKHEYYLWRFMIDARYQGMDFGDRALKLCQTPRKTPQGCGWVFHRASGTGTPFRR